MKHYGPTAFRVALGVLFLGAGLMKLMNPGMFSGMLTGLGFPAPVFFAWLVTAVEVAGGALLLLGWQTRYAAAPLAFVIVVAILSVSRKDPMQFLKDFAILGGLVGVLLAGPGRLCLDKHHEA
jgi:putative oxidoreductase